MTTFTLDNGLWFVVVERHEVPVVSFHSYADAGSVNEPVCRTGLAHTFEHMAFKGTTTIGTKNIEKEMEALTRQEEIYLKLRRENANGPQADAARIEARSKTFAKWQIKATSYVKQGEYEHILERKGVTRMNVGLSAEETAYMYSRPANTLELIFFRWRPIAFEIPSCASFTRSEMSLWRSGGALSRGSTGRLIEGFVTTAFKAHLYGQPTIGRMSDIKNLSRTDARAFFEQYYNANNLTIGIAGDVGPKRVKTLAAEYFSRLPREKEPLPVITDEPEQLGERPVILCEET